MRKTPIKVLADEDNILSGTGPMLKDIYVEARDNKDKPFTVHDEQLISLTDSFLNKAKRIKETDDNVMPIAAFASTYGAVRIMGLDWGPSYEEKSLAFKVVGAVAAFNYKMGTLGGVITIVDAHCKMVKDADKKAIEEYKQGDLAKDPEAGEALMITLNRPNQPLFSIIQPYRKVDGKVIWEEQTVLDCVGSQEMTDNLMPDYVKMADKMPEIPQMPVSA